MHRLFIGIKPDFNQAIFDACDHIKTYLSASEIKWVEKQNLHITILFLGETSFDLIDSIQKDLFDIAKSVQAFTIRVKDFGTFGKSSPKVLWLGTELNPELIDLYKKIHKKISGLSNSVKEEVFTPHLTIGRIKFLKQPEKIKELYEIYRETHFQTTEIKEILLFESILKPAGPEYRVIQKFPFN